MPPDAPPAPSARGAVGRAVQAAWAGTNTRLFCVILTTEQAWTTRRLAVRHTWAQRCDRYCFFYSATTRTSTSLPDSCFVQTPEGRVHLAAKTREALSYVHTHHRGAYDWVLKADDDTYVVVENLKALLSGRRPADPHYLGYLFQHETSVPRGHHSGGAGYVLSARALDLLEDAQCGAGDDGVEDLSVARCLQAVDVYAEDTKDAAGRITFHPEDPSDILTPHSKPAKYFTYTKANHTMGKVSLLLLKPNVTFSYEFMKAPA